MVYENSVCSIFNQPFIEAQSEQQHQNDQVIKLLDSANKLKDFLESTDKVEPDYQSAALKQYCIVITDYMKMHGML